MRRSASEVIRNLESRIARLEKSAKKETKKSKPKSEMMEDTVEDNGDSDWDKYKKGTVINPPPIPNNPATKPTGMAVKTINKII